jgi:PAS domain S-box-containing protein
MFSTKDSCLYSFGQLTSIHGYIHDQTDTKHAEESLLLSKLIKQHSREAIMVTDAHGIILSVNPTFCRVTGYTADEILGLRPSVMSSGHHDEKFYQGMWKSINEAGHWQGEILDRRKNGEIYPKWLSIHTAYDEQGSVFRRVAIFQTLANKNKVKS